jgi:hypothetical protein
LDWVLKRSPPIDWNLISCFGTESRSLAVLQQLIKGHILVEALLYRVNDKPSRYNELTKQRIKERYTELTRLGVSPDIVQQHDIAETHDEILRPLETFVASGQSNLILDVTCFPKRFFFPMLKRLLDYPTIKNIIVTYTKPKCYTPGKLAENFDDWSHLPMFTGAYSQESAKMLIVNVGFAPLGLKRELGQGEPGLPIKLLFPFPAPMRTVYRAWGFVQNLQKGRSYESFDLYRTDAKDLSSAFNRLISLTDGGKLRAELAPFGPKPISVAMCMFAVLTESEVFYTQPTVYHPDYSIGVSEINGVAETYAYWIRMNGRDLYSI